MFVKELTALDFVWQIAEKWDNTWNSYKTGKFKEIQADEMDGTAQTLFRKLSYVQKELKEKDWEIILHTKQRIETFRKTLPLLTDLKNPAMRQRHWDRIQEAIGRCV